MNRFFEIAPESHSLGKTSTSSANKSFGATHVMASALGCFQTLQTQWFERHARPAVFALRKPHFERHRLLRHDEHSVFLNAVSFRSVNLVYSAQRTLKALYLQCFLCCVFCECAKTITCVLPNVFLIIVSVARALEVLVLSCEIERHTIRCVYFCDIRFRSTKQVSLAFQ